MSISSDAGDVSLSSGASLSVVGKSLLLDTTEKVILSSSSEKALQLMGDNVDVKSASLFTLSLATGETSDKRGDVFMMNSEATILSSQSGAVRLSTMDSASGSAGDIKVSVGSGATGGSAILSGGSIDISSQSSSTVSSSDSMSLQSKDGMSISTGDALASSKSGDVLVSTGDSSKASSGSIRFISNMGGNVVVSSGSTVEGAGGEVSISVGSSAIGRSVSMAAGSGAQGSGGSVSLKSGSGVSQGGKVSVSASSNGGS